RVEGHEPVQDGSLQPQSGEVGLLVAGPLPGQQVARGQQQQGQVARPQRFGGPFGFRAHGASNTLLGGLRSAGRLSGSAPRPPPGSRPSSGLKWGSSDRPSATPCGSSSAAAGLRASTSAGVVRMP